MSKLELPSGIVTFLFTDIEGSTPLWDTLPEAMRLSLKKHNTILNEAITAHGGQVFKVIGDAFQAAFVKPTQAVEAAVAAQRALKRTSWVDTGPLRVRMGIHTGEAEAQGDDYAITHTLNRVARIMSAGHGGQILISQAVADLLHGALPPGASLRDMGQHRLKGLSRLEHIYQVMMEDQPQEFPPLTTLDNIPNNLPVQLTSFVGRESEIAEVKRLLGKTRLLTLTGPPGTGKTRLGLQVAADVLDQFTDGVYFVELAPISDPALVVSTISQLFSVRETAGQPLIKTLQIYLRDKRLLLLIDNFEQVIEASPLVGELLSAAPNVKILITSREALRVYGEQEYAVQPLKLPDLECSEPLQVLGKYEAVELFCQRARAVRSDFKLSKENAPYVCEVCARLDGLPLAIELAAARSKLLSPENMCARLESRLKTSTGGARDLPTRMQTLRAAIDWSYDLLKTDEQRLFERLSVFQGGRTIETVETVCNSDLFFAVLDGLESLLNKNLLFSKEGRTAETRFYMLETIHEYARERLAQSGKADDFKTRHMMYFVALAELAEAELHGAKQEYWYARLTDELDNIRTAFNWALNDGNVELGARLVAALRDFLYFTGLLLSESSAWIDRVLEYEGMISPTVRARTLNTYSRITYARGDFADGARLARQALSLAREINDLETCAWAHLFLSLHSTASYDQIKELLTLAEEGLGLFRELDHKAGIAFSLNTIGELARLNHDYAHARRAYEECRVISKETGNRRHEAISIANLSYVAYHEGNYNQAIDCGKKALVLSNSLQMEHMSAIVLGVVAGAIAAKGKPRLAAGLLSASQTQLASMGASIQPADKFEVDLFKEAVREQLGETDFNKAWAEGQGMSLDQAIAYALGEEIY